MLVFAESERFTGLTYSLDVHYSQYHVYSLTELLLEN